MKTILVIEDDKTIRDLFSDILDTNEYRVVAYDHCIPIDAVIWLEPHLIILDHYLTGQKGGEYCLELKKNLQSRSFPVLMFSAASRLKEISKQGFADGYIEKPFDINKLKSMVKTLAL